MKQLKILFIDNTAHHAYGQMHLMHAFAAQGHKIIVLIPNDNNYYNKIIAHGFECLSIKINGKALNPFSNLKLLKQINDQIKKINPNLVCSFTIKPNLFAAIAARKQKISIIVNITGLGYVFMQTGILHAIVIKLYHYAFRTVNCALFQNSDDRRLFDLNHIFTPDTRVEIIPGSGVDIKKFSYFGLIEKPVVFLFSGRILWDKGIRELVNAIKVVKLQHPQVKLIVMGNYFLANPSAVQPESVESWVKEGLLEYLGMVDNVEEIMRETDCIVLPSYREGLPRALMEACSMGKPIITVDSVGCREVIEDGYNGFLAKPKDVDSLATAMLNFIELSFADKVQMGLNGRRKMENEFDQQIVINKYLKVASQLCNTVVT